MYTHIYVCVFIYIKATAASWHYLPLNAPRPHLSPALPLPCASLLAFIVVVAAGAHLLTRRLDLPGGILALASNEARAKALTFLA